MKTISQLVSGLRDSQQAVRSAKSALGADGGSFASELNLLSIQKYDADLQARFAEATNQNLTDVFDYRLLLGEHSQAKAVSFAKSLLEFQEMFSVVFDAIKNGPKERGRIDLATLSESLFDFGYCYDGSLGVVLTLPNERLLTGGSDLDRAIETVFSIAASKTSEEIAAFAKSLGLPVVRRMFAWANTNAKSGYGADMRWLRKGKSRASFSASVEELTNLQNTIAQTSEETEKTVSVKGILLGLDVSTRKFHMEVEGGADIRGEMSPKIGTQLTVKLGTHYDATVLVKKQIHFATEVEDESYLLLSLE